LAKQRTPFLDKSDFIRSILSWNDLMVYGTQLGKVYICKNDKPIQSYQVASKAGSIENIIELPNGNLLIAPSKGLYQINTKNEYIWEISAISSLKNVVFTDSSMLMAYSQMLTKVKLTASLKKYLFDKNYSESGILQNEFKDAIENHKQVLRYSRCNTVSYDSSSKKFMPYSNLD